MATKTDTYGLDVVFNTKDGERSMTRLATVTDRATDKVTKMVKSKGYLLYSLKRIASYSAIFSFFGALIKMLGNVISLELALAEVNTLIDKTNQDAVDSYNEITQALLRLDPHLGNAIELTKGLYEIISAGVTDPVQAFELLQVSARYAKVGLTDLATASSSLTAVMKAYGFTAESMRKKSDVLFAAVREGKFHTDELNEAIGKVLPTAAAMNVSIEEISATLAIMTQRGLDVNEAATSLNRMLISFLRPMDKAQKQFTKLGWTWGRNAFEGIGLIGAMKRLEVASKRYGDLLPKIFRRQRALRGAFILQGAGLLDLQEMYERITDATLGAGIVQQEYGMITKTVSEEMKALYANILQAFSALLQHKGVVAYFIKEVSELLRVLVANVPVLMGFAAGILVLRKATVLLNTAMAQALILWATKIGFMVQGATAANAAALATRGLAFSTASLGAKMALALPVLTVAAGLYLVIKSRLDKWHESLEKQRQAIMDDAVQLKDYYDRMKDIAAIYEELTGKTLKYNQIIKEQARQAVLLDLHEQLDKFEGDFVKTHKVLMGVFKAAEMDWKNYQAELYALAAYFSGQYITDKSQETLKNMSGVLNTLGLRLGFLQKAAIDFIKNAAEGVPGMAEAIRAMDDEVLRLTRDLRMASKELQSLPGDIARRFTKEEIRDMLKAINALSAGLPDDLIAKLKYFGIDADKLAEDSLQLEHFKGALEGALDVWDETKAEQRIQDYQRQYEGSFRAIIYTSRDATEHAVSFFRAWQKEADKSPKVMEIVANANRKEIEKMIATAKNLPEYIKKFLAKMMAHFDKSTDKLVKIREKYKKSHDKMAQDMAAMGHKMTQLHNEYMGEQYKNVLVQFRRESAAYKKRAEVRLQLAIQSGVSIVDATIEHQKVMLRIQEWGQEAKKVSQFRALKKYLDDQKESLNAEKLTGQQRIEATKELTQNAVDHLKKLGTMDVQFLWVLLNYIGVYWKEIREHTDASRDKLGEYITFFRGLGVSISATAEALMDFATALGLQNTILGKGSELLSVVGEGVQDLGKHLNAIKQAKLLEGKGGLEGALGTIGKFAGMVGAVASIASTLVNIFKSIFGGETDAEKKAREAEEAAKKLAGFIDDFKQRFKELGDITDETAEKIYKLIEKGIPGYIAVSMSLIDLMNDTGISMSNFEAYAERMWKALEHGTTALWNTEEAAEVAGEAFSKLVEYAKKMGIEGHAAILEMIRKSKELGYEIKEISDYIADQLQSAAEGLFKMIKWVAADAVEAWEAMKDLNKERKQTLLDIKRIQQQMEGLSKGSDRWNELNEQLQEHQERLSEIDKELGKLQSTIDGVSTATKNQIKDIGIIIAGVFGAMVAEGVPMWEIFDKMHESVFALMDRYKALGMEVPKYLRSMFKQFRAFKKHPEFFEGLEGLLQTLEGLGNSGYLTVDAFKAINREARRYYDLLRTPEAQGGMGFGDEQAIRMMYPLLQQMWWYAEQYGMKLPKWAKEAMREAEALGLKFEKPATERLIDEVAKLTTIGKNSPFSFLRNQLRPPLLDMKGLLRDIERNTRQGYQHGSTGVPGGMAFLHKGEAVLPENVTSALKRFFVGGGSIGESGGGMLEAHIYIDGEKTYKALVPHIRKGGAYADFEVDGIGVR